MKSMTKKYFLLTILFPCIFLSLNSRIATAAELENGYEGVLLVAVHGFTNKDKPETTYTASKGSRFKVLNRESEKYVIRFRKKLGGKSFQEDAKERCNNWIQAGMPIKADSSENCAHVKFDTTYKININLLNSYDYRDASGIIAGPLAVPFKLQTKDWKLTAGGTIGAAVGYRWIVNENISLSPIVTAGFSFVTLGKPTNDNTTTSTETKVGFGAAGGVLLGVKEFQVGLLAGVDAFVDDYKYKNKLWLSGAIGYNFL